jgi:HEAT repeat protein
MENQQEYKERQGVLGGVASVLNAGGNVMVYAYDVTTDVIVKLLSVAKKVPVVPEKAFDIVVGGLGIVKPSEIKKVEEKIKGYEKKIRGLYYQIGKEGATYTGDESALETEPVKKLMANVREYEKEIQRLENRIVEIKEQKKAEAKRKRLKKAVPLAEERKKVDEEKVKKMVESVIAKAVRHGEFETRSELEIFDKVANDLLDSETEIKTLAAAELGKIGNDAGVPILMEAAKFDNPDLTSEIINSLITIGDLRAIPLFKEKATDPKHRVRIGCLRGLYKLAGDEEAMPVLTEALRDEHQEVRRTAATFIGWKDYADAVPALVQCLRDEDARVRKAAVSSLANIKDDSSVLALLKVLGDKDIEIREKAFEAIRVISGEEITFDVHASGKALTGAISNLRDWWQKERLGKVEITEAAEEVAPEAEAAEEVEEPEEEVTPPEKPQYAEEKLKRMVKSELLSICKDLEIECDETLTKVQIIELIVGKKK